MYLKLRHITKAKDHISSASEILGLDYNLVGKLGKRTKYQTTDIAQLAVEITLADRNDINRPEIEDITIPQNFGLNDDVRLDQVAFSEKTDSIKLPNTEQKLILTIIQQQLISSPDDLRSEEILPLLDTILNQKNTYTVRIMALLERCRLESKHKRTIERCLKQCEDIINHFSNVDPPAFNRIGDVFGTAMLPIWEIQAEYADILMSFGLVKNSLDVYLKIQLWEEVIGCYAILGMREKAAEIIRQQLEVKPTVKLMCLLGKFNFFIFLEISNFILFFMDGFL